MPRGPQGPPTRPKHVDASQSDCASSASNSGYGRAWPPLALSATKMAPVLEPGRRVRQPLPSGQLLSNAAFPLIAMRRAPTMRRPQGGPGHPAPQSSRGRFGLVSNEQQPQRFASFPSRKANAAPPRQRHVGSYDCPSTRWQSGTGDGAAATALPKIKNQFAGGVRRRRGPISALADINAVVHPRLWPRRPVRHRPIRERL